MIRLLIIFLLCLQQAFATTYYVKATGGTGSGLDDANAWSFEKLNSSYLAPGATILFKRDDTFYGSIRLNNGGSSGNTITFGAYGTGSNPVISGFTRVSSWTQSSSNVYYTALNATDLSMVTVNNAVQKMGRYPNKGYLIVKGHSGNYYITSNSVASLPFDPSGGELVIRKNRYILDRNPITSVSGNNINFNSGYNYEYFGINNSYESEDGSGFFIQNCLGALDQDGEWYYDKFTKRLYMYFNDSPNNRVVQAATINKIVSLNSSNYISFNNIDFDGGDYAIYCNSSSNITAQNCNFKKQGSTAFYSITSNTINFINNTVTDSNNNGFYGEYHVDGVNINNCSFSNIGTIAGMGRSGDATYCGIAVAGDNTTIQGNTVKNVGYNGIDFRGNDVLVEHNFVDTFCTLKDDGGGIYTWSGSDVMSNRIIRGNIILNAIGAYDGAGAYYYEPFGKAAGIYLDNNSNHVSVADNTIADGNWAGILINSNGNNQITNNLVYNHGLAQLYIPDYSTTNVRNNTITDNTFIAKTASQRTLYIELGVNDNPGLIGTFNNNIYARPIDDNLTITIYEKYKGDKRQEVNYSLDTWKSNYKQDNGSKKSSVTVSDIGKLKFDYNSKAGDTIVLLECFYTDVNSKLYNFKITLTAYSGSVLVKVANFKPVIIPSN